MAVRYEYKTSGMGISLADVLLFGGVITIFVAVFPPVFLERVHITIASKIIAKVRLPKYIKSSLS